MAGLVRIVLGDAMEGTPSTAAEALRGHAPDELVSLSALVVAEHILALIEAMFPGGWDRSHNLRAGALISAEQRLDEIRAQVEAGR